jgi:hypothetical protein
MFAGKLPQVVNILLRLEEGIPTIVILREFSFFKVVVRGHHFWIFKEKRTFRINHSPWLRP